jgi:WhiB family transcriptional regulator, redox-sensing transcriptional regulator
MWITDWTSRAACRGTDPNELFVQGAAQNRAKLICRGCSVRTECLADALDNGIEFGVWGGMTESERRALLRRRPDVMSWRDLLERARDEYERQGSDSLTTQGLNGRVRRDPLSGRGAPPAEPLTGRSATVVTPLNLGPRGLPTARVVSTQKEIDTGALEDRPSRRQRHYDAAARESAVDPAPQGPTETEIRQCCNNAYKSLLTFLALAGLPFVAARETARLVLSQAYIQSKSVQFPALQLRQIAQVSLQRYLSPAPAQPTFPASISISCQHVLALVAGLPEPQRLTLAWAVDGCSPADIANGTAHPLAAVLENLQRGRSALKHALSGYLEGESPEDDDDLRDADLDAILMEVADELADAAEEADITAVTEAIMAAVSSNRSVPGRLNSGDLRAIG